MKKPKANVEMKMLKMLQTERSCDLYASLMLMRCDEKMPKNETVDLLRTIPSFVSLKIPNCITFRSDNRLWSRYPKMRKVDLGAGLVVSSASVLLVIVISSTVVATSAEVHG